jgi:hypothetical protein
MSTQTRSNCKSNGHRSHGRGIRLPGFVGIRDAVVNPLISRIMAEWRDFRGQLKVPTVEEIDTLRRRVQNLEKKILR